MEPHIANLTGTKARVYISGVVEDHKTLRKIFVQLRSLITGCQSEPIKTILYITKNIYSGKLRFPCNISCLPLTLKVYSTLIHLRLYVVCIALSIRTRPSQTENYP